MNVYFHFPQFPDKDLSKEELDKYMDDFVEILTDKADTIYSTNRERNLVRVFLQSIGKIK